ncbi:hypothetical protein DFH09DRAFT_1169048 [Mycena vulgaris]|nr:hypothetical protein DFH09DRAFT_1169048 [Mycena vulgaris]
MLSTFTTTSTRRRGLRGASRQAPKEQLPMPAHSSADSAFYSLSTTSSSSFASDFAASRTSLATSETSYSHSSAHFTQDHSPFVSDSKDYRPAPQSSSNSSAPNLTHLSSIEVFKLRLAGRKHMRKDSAASQSSPTPTTGVRVVGRGGQGSRLRALPTDPDAPPSFVAPPLALPARDLRRGAPSTGPRIVGRGGVGSRPRGLSESSQSAPRPIEMSAPPPPPPLPTRAAALTQETPKPHVVYRPGGRGGAGSRPRKVKPQAENPSKEKEFKFPWHGKGKARAELTAKALTRTDTRDSTVSSIQFIPASTRAHQKPISTAPGPSRRPSTPSRFSFQSTSSDERKARRQSKLARTLGAGFADHAQAVKLSRRSSVSISSLPAAVTSSPQHSARRQSSYGSILEFLPPSDPLAASHSDSHHREVWDADNYRPAAQTYVAHPVTPAALYPAPPPPPSAFPEAPFCTNDDDDSEVLTFKPSAEFADKRFSFQMQSSGELHVQPRFSLVETDTDDAKYAEREREREWDRGEAQTPTSFAPFARADTPLADDKRFASPFQVMPLFVVPWEPAGAGARTPAQQEWTGQWNRGDMQSVIMSLRDLKM